jgi:hypothetical protein
MRLMREFKSSPGRRMVWYGEDEDGKLIEGELLSAISSTPAKRRSRSSPVRACSIVQRASG